MGGDFKQSMPIVGKQDFIKLAGKDKHEVQRLASIKEWKYFNGTDPHQFRVTRLKINNRLEPDQEKYRTFLKVIGEGLLTNNYHEEHIQVPRELQAYSREEIIKLVFEVKILHNKKFLNENIATSKF